MIRGPVRKNLDGRVTIRVSGDGATIIIGDGASNLRLIGLRMTPGAFTAALGGLAEAACEMDVYMHGKAGFVHENKTHEVCIGGDTNVGEKKRAAVAFEKEDLGEWKADMNFDTQDSFFLRDGKRWARATIRRYIAPDEEG